MTQPELEHKRSYLKDPYLRGIFVSLLLMGACYIGLYLAWGHGYPLIHIPLYNPIIFTLLSLTSTCICYLAAGRYSVLREPVSFWTSVSFLVLAVGFAFHVLTWPGLLTEGRSIIATQSGTTAFFFMITMSLHAVLLLVTDLAQGPTTQGLVARRWKWELGLCFLLAILTSILVIVFADYLPDLVSKQDIFTSLVARWIAIILVLFVLGTLLSIRRYLLSHDALLAYLSIFQIAGAFTCIGCMLIHHRYDFWWYLSLVVIDAGAFIILFGLLSEYVQLFKREQERSQQLEKAIESRNEFMTIASHELRTPITILKLQAQGIGSGIKRNDPKLLNPDGFKRHASQVDKQVGRLARLVDDMMDVSQIQSGKYKFQFEEVDLCSLIYEVTQRFLPKMEEAGVTSKLECCQPAIGSWDRSHIEQVIENLLTNAIKYGNKSLIDIRVEHDKSVARVQVRDQGRGIAKEDQERIFKRFERAISKDEVSGLGIGLYISEQIVTLHHGRIWVESELGRGSTFIVELPLIPTINTIEVKSNIPNKALKNGEI